MNSSPPPSDSVSPAELKQTLRNRLKETELEYFLDVCTGSNSVESPEDYFVGLDKGTRPLNEVATRLVNDYPKVVSQFIELNGLHFQQGNLRYRGLSMSSVSQGFDRKLLNQI